MNYARIKFLSYIAVVIAIKAFVLLFAWNNVMPIISSLPLINYQQSICLVVVFTCLFQNHRIMMIQSMLANLHNQIIFGSLQPRTKPQHKPNPPAPQENKRKNTSKKKQFKK